MSRTILSVVCVAMYIQVTGTYRNTRKKWDTNNQAGAGPRNSLHDMDVCAGLHIYQILSSNLVWWYNIDSKFKFNQQF